MEKANPNGKGILLVEDEPGITEVCTRTLSAEGFQVKAAPDGRAGLSMLSEREFALILIDIRTPEMNGIELYRHMEDLYPEMATKVVFTTGDVLSSDIKAFLDEAGHPYLAKPFTPDELRAAVKNALNREE